MIKYTKSQVCDNTYRTEKFGNLLSDTYQGQVEQGNDGSWAGWMFNWSNRTKTEFKLGMKSKKAATRWTNTKLREVGVE